MRLGPVRAAGRCLLLLLFSVVIDCVPSSGTERSVNGSVYSFDSGERVHFLRQSADVRYYPKESAGCRNCFVALKLGSVTELDSFGQPVHAHVIPDLSQVAPDQVSSGDKDTVCLHHLHMYLQLYVFASFKNIR